MRAVVLSGVGPPEALQLQEVAKPIPKDNEILIRVHATTVTAGDAQLRGLKVPLVFRLPLRIYLMRVRPKPVILGQELAGEVEAVGKSVTRWQAGDQVVAWAGLRLGAYAEYICLPETGVLAAKPPAMTYEEAATLPVGGLEAAYFIRRAAILRGERVLINGGGGSIGTYAVQIATSFGADVTAVDSAGKLEMLRSIGADSVLDYTREDFTARGETYDVIFDVIGKTSFARSLQVLTPHGRYLLGNPRPFQKLQGRWTTRSNGQQVIPWVGRTASEHANDFAFLTGLVEAGKLKAVVDRCFPLEQAAEAHRYVETGEKKGNVVIAV